MPPGGRLVAAEDAEELAPEEELELEELEELDAERLCLLLRFFFTFFFLSFLRLVSDVEAAVAESMSKGPEKRGGELKG